MRSTSPFILLFLASAVALAAEEIREIDGTTIYRKARVVEVAPDGIVVAHARGVTKVEFTRLSPEMQKRYGYDERRAKIFREQQTSRAAASEAERQRLLKEYEQRELARIQRQMESGASGEELVYGSQGAMQGAARGPREIARQMEQREDRERAQLLEPRTFWNSKFWDSPVVRVIGGIFGAGKVSGSSFGGSSSGLGGRGASSSSDGFNTPSYLTDEALKSPRSRSR